MDMICFFSTEMGFIGCWILDFFEGCCMHC